MTTRVADYTLTRDEFMRAVKRATQSKALIEQAERQEWFPLEAFFDPDNNCGCVVGEYLCSTLDERSCEVADPSVEPFPPRHEWLDRVGVRIDEAVRDAIVRQGDVSYGALTEGLVQIVDGEKQS